jgi:peptidylprolyl isomerase
MRKLSLLFILILTTALIVNCGSDKKPEETKVSSLEKEVESAKPIVVPEDAVETESGLKYVDLKIGEGDMPEKGQRVAAHYTGKLMDGTKFDSSYDRNEPIEFSCGMREMIPGFDEGIMSMKVGGKRTLYIPANLAYGERGIPNVIPPNSMIVFEVELVDIK